MPESTAAQQLLESAHGSRSARQIAAALDQLTAATGLPTAARHIAFPATRAEALALQALRIARNRAGSDHSIDTAAFADAERAIALMEASPTVAFASGGAEAMMQTMPHATADIVDPAAESARHTRVLAALVHEGVHLARGWQLSVDGRRVNNPARSRDEQLRIEAVTDTIAKWPGVALLAPLTDMPGYPTRVLTTRMALAAAHLDPSSPRAVRDAVRLLAPNHASDSAASIARAASAAHPDLPVRQPELAASIRAAITDGRDDVFATALDRMRLPGTELRARERARLESEQPGVLVTQPRH